MSRLCFFIACLAACNSTPKRWVYLSNPTNQPRKVVFRQDPKEEASLHEIAPRSYLSLDFSVGDYFITTFDPAGKANTVPLKVDRPSQSQDGVTGSGSQAVGYAANR